MYLLVLLLVGRVLSYENYPVNTLYTTPINSRKWATSYNNWTLHVKVSQLNSGAILYWDRGCDTLTRIATRSRGNWSTNEMHAHVYEKNLQNSTEITFLNQDEFSVTECYFIQMLIGSVPNLLWYNFSVADCGCDNTRVHISATSNHFQDHGQIECSNGGLLVNTTTLKLRTAPVETTCLADASWKFCDYYACWSAPTTEFELRKVFRAGSTVYLTCNITNRGYPEDPDGTVTLYVNRKKINTSHAHINQVMIPFSPEPDHNKKNLSCVASNNLTRLLMGTDEYFSGTRQSPITVLFGPTNVTTEESCYTAGENGQYVSNIKVAFYINAYHEQVCVVTGTANGSCESLEQQTSSSMLYGVTQKIYAKHLNVTTLQISAQVRYQLMENETDSVHPVQINISHCPVLADTTTTSEANQMSTFTSSLTDGTSRGEGPDGQEKIIAIAVSAAGGFVLLLLILLLCRLIISKRNKGMKKEEVINPIYDTTSMSAAGMQDADKSKSSERVERENPLYGTTAEATYAPIKKKKKAKKGSSSEQPEVTGNETYATVVKPKKGKQKGTDNGQSNDAFSGEADATYAAVNKKKRADKSEDEPSTSGLGNNTEVPQDCTYAAVQKKGKRKPKDDDEDLHGSSK